MGDPADPDDIGREPTAHVQPETDTPKRRPRKRTKAIDASYEVICISLYTGDLVAARAKVAALKERGIRRANLSWLIRIALERLDIDTITKGDRP